MEFNEMMKRVELQTQFLRGQHKKPAASESPHAIAPAYSALLDDVGPRLSSEDFETYVQTPESKAVLESLIKYSGEIEEAYSDCTGIVLYGATGVGKDHLVMGCAKAAFRKGLTVKFINGPQLRAKLRMPVGAEVEEQLIESMLKPNFLWVSDLIMAGDPLSPYQCDIWYRIVDRRWQLELPIWITINGRNSDDLAVMGRASLDRLKHNSVIHFCNWGSYRRKKS